MALVTVSTHENPIEARIFAGRLQVEGMPVFLASEHHVRINWLVSTALGGVHVQVPQSCVARAQSIVAAIRAGDYDTELTAEVLRCRACRSGDVDETLASWRLAFLALFVLNIPLPYSRQRVRCRNCGYVAHRTRFHPSGDRPQEPRDDESSA